MTANQNTSLKTSLFVLILAVLLLPLSQQLLQFAKVKKLHGQHSAAPPPGLSWEAWRNDTLQRETEAWLNENFGFRRLFVRLHNQLNYSLFNEAHAKDVIVGKNGYFFGESYIRAAYGGDFIGEELIDQRVRMMEELRDSLATYGTELLLLLAPGKASYMPENIPPRFREKYPPGRTNYDQYQQAISARKLPCFNAKAWFDQMKDTTRYPLYPKVGIHWSTYGARLVLDSLSRYQASLFDEPVVETWLGPDTPRDSLNRSDRDIEFPLNLLFSLDGGTMNYPEVRFRHQGRRKLKSMAISDSHWFTIYSDGYAARLYQDHQFWYYRTEVFEPAKAESAHCSKYDLHKLLREQDIVLLIATDAKLKGFAWGFLRQALMEGFPGARSAFTQAENTELAEITKGIQNTPKWMGKVRRKAAVNGVSVALQLQKEAYWVFKNRRKKEKEN